MAAAWHEQNELLLARRVGALCINDVTELPGGITVKRTGDTEFLVKKGAYQTTLKYIGRGHMKRSKKQINFRKQLMGIVRYLEVVSC